MYWICIKRYKYDLVCQILYIIDHNNLEWTVRKTMFFVKCIAPKLNP